MKYLKPLIEWHSEPSFGKKIYVKIGSIALIASFPTQLSDQIVEVAQ